MASIGDGYGSECHLLRYLGRHRQLFDREVMTAIGADEIEWQDFHFDPESTLGDSERSGLDFLAPDHSVLTEWTAFWPRMGSAIDWDAVARIKHGGKDEWLFVEAKANTKELQNSCAAVERSGRPLIEAALAATKKALGVAPSADWLNGYYQAANRITVLQFLYAREVPARLLFVYFTGDQNPAAICPVDQAGWEPMIAAQNEHLGIQGSHPRADRIHTLFIEARPGSGAARQRAIA